MDRRFFVKAGMAGVVAAGLPRPAHAVADFGAPYAPVFADAAREIRTVAGLRPYRPAGFRIRAERFGRHAVIHNYGHGGCGVSLCWGSAQLAIAEAAAHGRDRAAVIGAGAIGLATALMLLRRGVETTIYADRAPPETTSNIAAAVWGPATLFRAGAVDERFLATYRRVARASHFAFQHYANDPAYGVRWIRFLTLRDEPRLAPHEPSIIGDDLFPGARIEADPRRYFGFPQVEAHYQLMIDTDVFLRALTGDIERAGGRFAYGRLHSLDDVLRLKERLVFNCTGLGARALFGDESLTPVRGQLTMLLPQPGIDYGYVYNSPGGLLYMFPRVGAIVLGGNVQYGDASTEPRESERERMIAGHAALSARIASAAH
jgi:glycine/D-amino acid oxidase-like deaminating enzyme